MYYRTYKSLYLILIFINSYGIFSWKINAANDYMYIDLHVSVSSISRCRGNEQNELKINVFETHKVALNKDTRIPENSHSNSALCIIPSSAYLHFINDHTKYRALCIQNRKHISK